ncbi:hypothetical protein B5X24_HaOG205724 [Helicoverpa armigera]|uniref:Uncharacterized protein n=1 Tax=Helicoverpa armigera TaxID=29058 RepID=A0A2W1BKU0_HELAM|nr:hypothetical protein B5X24_HaOG205724 [Helicoverpa armigera]
MARCWLTLAGLLALARAPGAAAADPPECPLPARCKLGGYGQNEYPYTVDGLQVMIQYTDSGYFALKCPKNITLDNPALPRFKSKLRVSKAQLEDCPAPRDSYADALERLNVLVLDKLKLVRPGALRAAHLAPLGELPALELLRVTSCALAALPAGLLDAAPDLLLLDLSDNRLTALPGGLFVVTKKLRMLNLSRNRLTTNVFDSLAAVTSLTTLNLSFNDLKDSCGGAADTVRGSSPLQYLTSLEKFYLRKTNTSVICQDWRTSMSRLKELDLSYNNISVVTFTDLRFSSEAEVDLRRNPVARLEYSRDDVSRAAAVTSPLAAECLVTYVYEDDVMYEVARASRAAPRRSGASSAWLDLSPQSWYDEVCRLPNFYAYINVNQCRRLV